MVISEEDLRLLKRNEEKLWDLAAITAAPLFYQVLSQQKGLTLEVINELACENAYDLADALIKERNRRFLKEKKD